jgi:cytochrome bd ubiquinol oxidase subunit I
MAALVAVENGNPYPPKRYHPLHVEASVRPIATSGDLGRPRAARHVRRVEDLLAARLQMAISLGLHIVFACIGMTMPWLVAAAEWRWLQRGDEADLRLAKAWSKGVAVLFAVGAVSGTVLSIELGLLWPRFMKHAGPVIGMPFSWEGTAFFIEAIAIGLYLYGWERLQPWLHWGAGIVVGLSGVASGVLVVAANAWMNAPQGFEFVDGVVTHVDPVAAMFNRAWPTQAMHMVLAAFASTGFAVAGVHAYRILRGQDTPFHQRGLRLALWMGAVAALLQPLSGDLSAKMVAETQPAKLAAAEAHFHTARRAPLLIGGIPNRQDQTVSYGIEIPGALSFLAHGDLNAEVTGLDQIPEADQPPVFVTHLSFQLMVACGIWMATLGLAFVVLALRGSAWLSDRRFLWAAALSAGTGFVATEAGWIVTEVGRQPYIIHGVMKTRDALTPMPGLGWSLLGIIIAYAVLSLTTLAVMISLIRTAEGLSTGGKADG